jgi:hypothetical protein
MTIKTTTPLQSTQGETGLPRYFQAVFDQASRMEHGRLDMVLPDGRVFRAEGPKPGPVAELHIHNTDIFARLIREGDLGFCEAYLDEWWSTPDLQAFMDLVHADNEEVYDGFPGDAAGAGLRDAALLAAVEFQAAGEEEHLLPLRPRQRILRALAR